MPSGVVYRLMSSGDGVVLFIYVVLLRAKHVHFVCVSLFVKQRIFVIFKIDLVFFYYIFFNSFCFLIVYSSVLRTEYSCGRRPIYSAVGVPAHSSFILPQTFLFVSL